MIDRRRVLAILGVVLLALAGTAAWLRRSFSERVDREIADLLAAAQPPAIEIVTDADLEPLPDPVRRWLRASGVVGTAVPAVVQLEQRGQFRLGANRDWMDLRATQYYTTNPPGFLWKATMEMFPLVEVVGRDRYTGGNADIEMRVAGLVPVADKSGGNLNGGALLRFLNETMWFPAAVILPNITWEPIDDRSARATLTDHGQSVSAVFHFDDQDRLVDMTAERWNDAEQAMRPWSTPIGGWDTLAGITVANQGTGVWGTGPEAYDYVRLRVTDLRYDPE